MGQLTNETLYTVLHGVIVQNFKSNVRIAMQTKWRIILLEYNITLCHHCHVKKLPWKCLV